MMHFQVCWTGETLPPAEETRGFCQTSGRELPTNQFTIKRLKWHQDHVDTQVLRSAICFIEEDVK
jgi:hypothetical protein